MHKIRVTRVAVNIEEHNFEGYYDSDTTLEQAVEEEKNLGPEDGWGEYFFESDRFNYTTIVEVTETND